jgi:hypothetical protein
MRKRLQRFLQHAVGDSTIAPMIPGCGAPPPRRSGRPGILPGTIRRRCHNRRSSHRHAPDRCTPHHSARARRHGAVRFGNGADSRSPCCGMPPLSTGWTVTGTEGRGTDRVGGPVVPMRDHENGAELASLPRRCSGGFGFPARYGVGVPTGARPGIVSGSGSDRSIVTICPAPGG